MKAETSDEVLIARLKALGYSVGVPEAADDDDSAEEGTTDGEEDVDAAEFARYRANAPTLLDRLLAAREAKKEMAAAEEEQSRRKLGGRGRALPGADEAPSSSSPTKRPRRPSSPSSFDSGTEAEIDSAGPATPCPAGPSRRASTRRLVTTSPTPTKKYHPSSSSVKLAGMATLALFSSKAQAAAPFSSPFVGAAHSLDEVLSGVDLRGVVSLAQNLQQNQALFHLAQAQASATGRQIGSNLNFLGKHLFADSPVSPQSPAQAALRLARLLDLDAAPSSTASPTNRSALPVLTTPRTTCIQCNSALHLREHPDEPVWLVRPAQAAEQCLVAIYICSNRPCRARHAPDHVEIAYEGRSVWLWYHEATVVKVGERVWTTMEGAAYVRHLLLQQAVTPGGFAKLWNRQYCESPLPENDEVPDSDDENLEEEDEITHARSATASPRKRKRARDAPFRLRAAHVWRAIVVVSCLKAAHSSPYGRFASAVRPSTLSLVELANACLFDPVLPPHQCSTCTRPRQRWIGGPATDAERRAGVLWAGTQDERSGQAFAEDVELVAGPPIQMAICDGITIGHFLCAAPGCPNSPEKHRRASRFCDDHYDLHDLCSVIGCGRERSGIQSGGGLSEACDYPDHEERWLEFVRRTEENRDRGWRGRANEPRRRPENAAPNFDPLGDDGDSSDGEDEDGDEDEASEKGGKKRLTHMWAMRKSSNLQLLVASCGTPLAWASFTSGETIREVLDFLAAVHGSYAAKPDALFPSYIAYDRACEVLRHVATSIGEDSTEAKSAETAGGGAELPPLLRDSRLIVDGFHRQCHHRDDLFCSTLCNSAPLDGSAPDLVIPLKPCAGESAGGARTTSKSSERSAKPMTAQRKSSRKSRTKMKEQGRVFQRAFNTSAAEQLNSHLSRFAFVLAGMRAPNFTFLVHVLLRYRREEL
ncbi:hypothetical protein JCM10908_005104 [Rhodotorula pacifica]|uniref:uncharacterized protein n=1 Tax=Rhodotorula pacifica TaxID=1495444 RepID=UPI00317AE41C